MAFEFDKLTPEAKRAAFAAMDRKKAAGSVGKGGKGSSSGSKPGGNAPAGGSAAAAAPARKSAAEKIADAYTKLAGDSPNGFVSLVDLRRKIGGLSRQEEDAALKELSRTGKAHLAGLSNRKLLTADDHDSAIRVGGEDNHQIMMVPDKKPPALPASKATAPKPGAARKKMAAAKPRPAAPTAQVINPKPGGGFQIAGRISREDAAIQMFGSKGAAARIAKANAKKKRRGK